MDKTSRKQPLITHPFLAITAITYIVDFLLLLLMHVLGSGVVPSDIQHDVLRIIEHYGYVSLKALAFQAPALFLFGKVAGHYLASGERISMSYFICWGTLLGGVVTIIIAVLISVILFSFGIWLVIASIIAFLPIPHAIVFFPLAAFFSSAIFARLLKKVEEKLTEVENE